MQETFDMIKKFLEDNKLRLAEGTLKNYGYTLNSFFVYMQKDYKTIRTKDVREWIAKLMNDGLKPFQLNISLLV